MTGASALVEIRFLGRDSLRFGVFSIILDPGIPYAEQHSLAIRRASSDFHRHKSHPKGIGEVRTLRRCLRSGVCCIDNSAYPGRTIKSHASGCFFEIGSAGQPDRQRNPSTITPQDQRIPRRSTGITSEKQDPTPKPLFTASVPPKSSASLRDMESPNPVPLKRRCVSLST